MLSERMKEIIRTMPKAENHIHIEGSIPWKLAIQLAKKNGAALPYRTEEEIRKWTSSLIASQGLNGFMICNRMINSACVEAEDYEKVILNLAENAQKENIIYQEYHLDYPLSEERGIPIRTVMEGYRRGKERALKEYGVDIVYIAGIDRTQPLEKCLDFVRALGDYLDVVEGLGMDCEERGYPCRMFEKCYIEAEQMGLFLTAHAGEDDTAENIKDALEILHVKRIDHGCRAADDPELMQKLKADDVLCAMCPVSNTLSGAARKGEEHPAVTLMRFGVPVSISSDDPPYVNTLSEEYEAAVEKIGFSESELIQAARNAFAYSIRGQKYIPLFDEWAEKYQYS